MSKGADRQYTMHMVMRKDVDFAQAAMQYFMYADMYIWTAKFKLLASIVHT